ncbi:MAG: RsmD family RNA methyltransferase [Deltaproteobacteria bacterium]|nr:RsmD family RNA methyltransferase [Deltaproteobacteria bacterium]
MATKVLDVEVQDLADSGEGLARHAGSLLLVPGALPGERVRVSVEGRAKHVAVVEWLERSPERIEPKCAVAGRCGGCDWQHVSLAMQRGVHRDAVRRSLPPALRGVEMTEELEPLESELSGFRYRTRARLAWSMQGGELQLGHRARGSRDVVDTRECVVLHAILERALIDLARELPTVSDKGELFLALGADQKPVASLRPEGKLLAGGFAAHDRLVAAGFAGAELYAPGASVPNRAGDPRPCVLASDGAPLWLAPEGFAQAHEGLNGALGAYVAEQAQCEGRKVLELFAGAGNLTVLLARRAKKVRAVELDRLATLALQGNVAARGLRNVSVQCEGAERVVTEGFREEVVVLDPPRTGAREVCEIINKTPPRTLVYVSCDPPTFGRDAGILSASMELVSLRTFEMFPQTVHVEVVGTFVRRRKGSP